MPLTCPRAALGAVAFVLTLAPAAAAQRVVPDPFAPGARVRVSWRDLHRQDVGNRGSFQVLRGTVLRATPDTLVLSLGPGTAAIPRPAIAGMSVSRGVSSRGASALRGAVGGALWAGVLGAVAAINDRGGWQWDTVGDWAAWGAGIGLVSGATWPAERWRRVPRGEVVGSGN